MKKLDKLVLRSFIGPFFLTFAVATFILLLQTIMRFFDDLFGKSLSVGILAEFMTYFAINVTPVAFPLAVLLSSIMTFGNLAQHSELTAIKSSGISLTRVMRPLFLFVLLLAGFAYFNNDQVVPRTNLRAYSLLWDIKRTKPTLDIQEGAFYAGLPNYRIKVNEKLGEDIIKDVIIYDHSKQDGSVDVIMADSGRMYTIMGDRYLKLDLYDGNSYSEMEPEKKRSNKIAKPFMRNNFTQSELVFSLASFDMERTDKDQFSGHWKMKTSARLNYDLDSIRYDVLGFRRTSYKQINRFYTYHLNNVVELPEKYAFTQAELDSMARKEQAQLDSLAKDKAEAAKAKMTSGKEVLEQDMIRAQQGNNKPAVRQVRPKENILLETPSNSRLNTGTKRTPQDNQTLVAEKEQEAKPAKPAFDVYTIKQYDTALLAAIESVKVRPIEKERQYRNAANAARFIKNHMLVQSNRIERRTKDERLYEIERDKKLAQAVACFIMFLIGAPLGVLIRKGGIGWPVVISIVFFIIYYVLITIGEKQARLDNLSPIMGTWMANMVLLPFGLYFLRQARRDARVFDADFYTTALQKLFSRKKQQDAGA